MSRRNLGFIYFARAVETDFVKIGWTAKNVAGRIRDLQVGNPFELKVMGMMHGTLRQESAMHLLFAKDRARGEWFRLSPELAEWISRNTRTRLRIDGVYEPEPVERSEFCELNMGNETVETVRTEPQKTNSEQEQSE